MLLSLREVSKVYRTGDVSHEVLRGISLEVARGEYLSVTGSSGSGKSTLLHILGCLDVPTSGSYLVEGQEVSERSDPELARLRNRAFGFVFQSFNLLGRYTAVENVALPMTYRGVGRRERLVRARELLVRMGLDGFFEHLPSQLSGGMQQRVALARALANEPAVLFADEPTGNLDSRTGLEIIELFGELHAGGTTLVVVTHEARVAERAARWIRLEDGRIAADSAEGAPP